MQTHTETKRVITITLEEVEAEWLKNFIQNPHCPPGEEPYDQYQMREALFNSLKGLLE